MQIPPYQDQIEKLYSRLQQNQIRSIVITSANRLEGVSSTAQALTHRLLLAGHSALLVDLNILNPSTQYLINEPGTVTKAALAQPTMISTKESEQVFLGVRAEPEKALVNQLKQPLFLKQQMELWKNDFDYIIVDAPPLLGPESDSVQTESLAAICDACLFVVLACRTSDRMVSEALRKLRQGPINLVGCILNDQFNPSLRAEFVRELERVPHVLRPLVRKLSQWIEKSSFLAMEV